MRALNPLEVRGLTNLVCLVENMKVNKVYLCVGNEIKANRSLDLNFRATIVNESTIRKVYIK